MPSIELDEFRAAIAACSVVEEGSTQAARQRANAKRINLYAALDGCRSELDKLKEVADSSSNNEDDTSETEVRWHGTRTVYTLDT